MATARLEADALLRKVLSENTDEVHLYFQPPSGYKLKYPCIVYSMSKIRNNTANDDVYIQHSFYTVTVIDSDPDSKIAAGLSRIPKCGFDRQFVSDNLYHTSFTLYV
jgi:hypothetical protein